MIIDDDRSRQRKSSAWCSQNRRGIPLRLRNLNHLIYYRGNYKYFPSENLDIEICICYIEKNLQIAPKGNKDAVEEKST